MRKCLLLALTAASLRAAVIRGTVVENQTGHPLARALVSLEAVAGSAGPKLEVRTNSYGIFEFPAVPGGTYLITAARRAFAPVQFGQKRWSSAGAPIVVGESDSPFITIRLPRFGAVAGTLLDENDVGLPDHEVVIYRDVRPPVLLAKAKTDDRGMYRFFGLGPGRYLVRTLSKGDEEGTYLPTFYRDVATVDQAMPVEVTLDQQLDNVIIRPATGRLFNVAGRAYGPSSPIIVTMSSDMGAETATVDLQGSFKFNPAAPGQYELLAVLAGRTPYAAYQPLSLDKDLTGISLSLSPYPTVQFTFEDTKGQPVDTRSLQVLMRREDLTGPGPPQTVRDLGGPGRSQISRPVSAFAARSSFMPGRWDVALAPTASWYAVSVSMVGQPAEGGDQGRADGWNEILLAPGSQNTVKFVLSNAPARLYGVARDSGGSPVAGMPVFLEAYDLAQSKRLADVQMARTDVNGRYLFAGLAPGTYRLLATFEYQTGETVEMETPAVKSVKVDEGRDVTLDLEQYVIR